MRVVTDDTVQKAIADSQMPYVILDSWCQPCKALHRALAELENTSNCVEVLSIDIDENSVAAQGKTAVPQLDFYFEGQLKITKIGAMSKRQLLTTLDSLSSDRVR